MPKLLAAALTTLFVAGSSLAYGQDAERFSPADLSRLTDARIAIVKAVLQLSPEQTKYWPAVEGAIRARSQNRQSRIDRIVETVGRASSGNAVELLRNRNTVDFLNRRSEALAQRSADIKKLADAWAPLYGSMSPEQKQRLAALAIITVRHVSDALEQRRGEVDDDDEWMVVQ